MAQEEGEGYAVHSAMWFVIVDGTDEEDRVFADAVKDELGGKIVTFSASGVKEA